MKTTTTLCAIFCMLSFATLSQHDHEELEHLFSSHSISDFENVIGVKDSDIPNMGYLNFIDSAYQNFYQNIEHRLRNDEEISDEQFMIEYQELASNVASMKNKFGKPIEIDFTPKAADGPCVNMDFETGDTGGWELTRGDVDGSAPYSYVGEVPVAPGPYHQIFGGGLDPVTGIQRVNPLGGGFSARLGNGTGVGARAARLRQTFLVDATNFMFTYSYAVIFESPAGHALNQLPYFTVRVFDSLGNSVPCGEYSVIADAANTSDYESVAYGGSTVLYKDWEAVFTNLSAFIGQNVTIEFTAGDCSLTGHFGYAYVDASCGMSDIIASQSTICTGDSSILTAPAGAASYTWSNGATTQSTTVYTGGTYTCTLTPFQGGGCSIDLDITINEYPSPTADFVPSTVQVCVAEPIIFADQSTIPNPGIITSYRWDFGDGNVTPPGTGVIGGVANTTGTYLLPEHYYDVAGVYNVELWVTTADGCSDSITIPVTINALPIVVAGLDQTVCEGTAVTLSGSGALSYVWNNGVTDGLAFVQTVGTNTYTVTGTDINGCQNTDQVDVTVNPLPIVNAGIDQTVCEGTAVTLSGTGANAYAWDNGVTDGMAFTPAVGTLIYTVIGTDVNGCSNTDVVNVTVNALPTVDAGIDQTVCDGVSVTLSGTGASSYVWDNGVLNGQSFVQAVGTITYTAIGTDANGCQNTDQVDVTINPLPIVNAGVDQTVCEGTAVTLNGSGALSYVWSNGVIDGQAFVQAVGTIIYTVTGADANGCQNTDQVDVTVNPLPVIDAGVDQVICEGTNAVLSGSGGNVYAWDNGIIDLVAFTPTVGTLVYTVIGTDLNGCSNTDVVSITVNPLPVVDAGVDQTVCEGELVMLSGTGASIYHWNNGVLDNVAFNAPVGTTTYAVTGIDVNGCQNTDQVDVTVLALPIVIAGADQEICEGTSVTFSGSGALSYVWTGGITDNVPFVNAVGQYAFIVSGTDVNQCSNTDTVQLIVNPNPIVDAGADQMGCEGEAITLNATGSGCLCWDNNVVNGVPFVQNVGLVVYTLTDTLLTGCRASDSLIVQIHPNPTVTAADIEICENEGVILNGSGADTYSWSHGIMDDVEFFPTETDDYAVVGSTIYGCVDSFTVSVTVHPTPFIDFKILKPSMTTVDPSTGFDNLSIGAISYEWSFGDGSPYSTDFEPYHTFPDDQSGSYEVILTGFSAFGCPGEKVKYVYILQDYTIYVPNSFTPDGNGVNEIFKPILEGFDEDEYTLYIFNRWGEIVFESHDMQVGWDGKFGNRGREDVQDGVYTWKVEAGFIDSADSKIFVGHVSLLK